MKKYTVVLAKSAEKELYKLPNSTLHKMIKLLETLETEPRPNGCKKLKGYDNLWRVRVGHYRIIYSIEDVILLVDVKDIGHRKNIYN
jgi:mRNA interferase RelE/StbE